MGKFKYGGLTFVFVILVRLALIPVSSFTRSVPQTSIQLNFLTHCEVMDQVANKVFNYHSLVENSNHCDLNKFLG